MKNRQLKTFAKNSAKARSVSPITFQGGGQEVSGNAITALTKTSSNRMLMPWIDCSCRLIMAGPAIQRMASRQSESRPELQTGSVRA
jgi:hypothetical protein